MNSAIDRMIQQIYKAVYKTVFTQSNVSALSKGNAQPVRNAFDLLDLSQDYNKFAQKFAAELTKKGINGQKGTWKAFYQAAKSKNYIGLPKTLTAYEAQVAKTAIEQNFQMIKSIPTQMKEILAHKYTSTLIQQVAEGKLGRKSFETQLMKHGYKQAKVIARTETAKLQTVILEERAVNVGSVVYKWRSSQDKRTRPSHKAMNDVIVFWKQAKPILDNMQGHAGEFPNCRCTPQPILDEDDLKNTSYRVYDYRTHQIIRLTRNELIKAIRQGHL